MMAERFRPIGMHRVFSLQGVEYLPSDDGWISAPNSLVAEAMRAAGLVSEMLWYRQQSVTWANRPDPAKVPLGTVFTASDIGAEFRTDGQYWHPLNGRALLSNQLTDITMALDATEQSLWSFALLPGLVFPGASLEFQFNGEKLGGVADTCTFRLKINGNTLTNPTLTTTNIALGSTNRFQRTSATTVRKLGGGGATVLAALTSSSTTARVAAILTQDMDAASNTIQVTGQMTTGGTEYGVLSGFSCFLVG